MGKGLLRKLSNVSCENADLLYCKPFRIAVDWYKDSGNNPCLNMFQAYDVNKVQVFSRDVDLSGSMLELNYLEANNQLGEVALDIIDTIHERRVVLVFESTKACTLRYITSSFAKVHTITLIPDATLSICILHLKLSLTDGSISKAESYSFSNMIYQTSVSSDDETDPAYTSFSGLSSCVRMQGDKNFNPPSNTDTRFRMAGVFIDDRCVFIARCLDNNTIHDYVSGLNCTVASSAVGDASRNYVYKDVKLFNDNN